MNREHDLPPYWDGQPVQWRDWQHLHTTLIYHQPLEHTACEQCAVLDHRASCVGTLRTVPPQTLLALRCTHCKLDTVVNINTHEQWTLDASDYTAEGSYELGQQALLPEL